mmetsp:Transcript_105115/g.279736  ORF Transcript_105115/g.279736 Transcript_105115/m.279736 type:complete len:205 (-) Transcript_105115:89-703(-)
MFQRSTSGVIDQGAPVNLRLGLDGCTHARNAGQLKRLIIFAEEEGHCACGAVAEDAEVAPPARLQGPAPPLLALHPEDPPGGGRVGGVDVHLKHLELREEYLVDPGVVEVRAVPLDARHEQQPAARGHLEKLHEVRSEKPHVRVVPEDGLVVEGEGNPAVIHPGVVLHLALSSLPVPVQAVRQHVRVEAVDRASPPRNRRGGWD